MYNPGDKFIIEVEEVKAEMCKGTGGTHYRVKDNLWLPVGLLDEFDRYEEPKPVTWRDGAVEKPISNKKVIIAPKNNISCFNWRIVSSSTNTTRCWELYLWIYIDDFPMPSMPAPQIEPCHHCGKEMRMSKDVYGYQLECSCGCKSPYAETERAAIKSHNAISRKVRGE